MSLVRRVAAGDAVGVIAPELRAVAVRSSSVRAGVGGGAGAARAGDADPDSQTTPSPSPSRMNGYAGWSRVTGAIPCVRASAQLTRPFRSSSHSAMLSFVLPSGAAADRCTPARDRDQRGGRARRQHAIQGIGLTLVNGELVFLADRDHPRGEPATVLLR